MKQQTMFGLKTFRWGSSLILIFNLACSNLLERSCSKDLHFSQTSGNSKPSKPNSDELTTDNASYKSQPAYKAMLAKFHDSCAGATNSLIEAEDLLQLQQAQSNSTMQPSGGKIVLLDAREPKEQAVSMIPGAIPARDFNPDQANPKTTYVVYCTIGCRSGQVTASLMEKGINAKNLIGGVLAWSWVNGPLQTQSGENTKRIHVYSKTWNFLNPGYTAVE